MAYLDNLKIAIVHDWFDKYAGSERVVEQMLQVFPQADLFALVDFLPEKERSFLKGKPVTTTFLRKLPFARKKFRSYLPLFPMAIEQIDLRGYHLILSSSHAVAKGVLTQPDQLHICYCHSPMRYVWDLYHQYLEEAGLQKGIKAFFVKMALHYLRNWDQASHQRVNYFLANSAHVAKRILKNYGRKAEIIYPPVDTHQYTISNTKGNYYFSAARMVPYKKLDLIAEAFSAMPDKQLIIAGKGEELNKIKRKAGPNVIIKDHLSASAFQTHLREAKAFVYAAEEDFGIILAEAQAAGVPVIAYQKGGASEIVRHDETGILYSQQTTESLINAVNTFEQKTFQPEVIRQQAEQFSIAGFQQHYRSIIDRLCHEFFNLQ